MDTATPPSTKPVRYYKNLLPITEIYGYAEGVPVIADHPKFPNPRRVMSRELIDAIKGDGYIEDEIALYHHTDGCTVPLDGKTRLTSAAEVHMETPTTTAFREVPFKWFTGTYMEARVYQLKRNVPGRKEDLTELEVALYLKGLLDEGMESEELKDLMGWVGKGGTRKFNSYMDVITGDTAVLDGFISGSVELAEAVAINRDERLVGGDKARAADVISQAKAEGKDKIERRKEANIDQQRVTTMSYKATVEYAADLLPDVLLHMRNDAAAGGEEARIDGLKASIELYAFIDERRLIYTFEACLKFLKAAGSMRERILWLQAQMSEDQKIGMIPWLPNI